MKKVLVVMLMAFSFPVIADGPGWTQTSEVIRVVVVSNGGVNVRLNPELQGCTSQSGYGVRYASIYPDHPGLDKIYSALLSTKMSGEKIALYLSDDTCKVTEIIIGGGI